MSSRQGHRLFFGWVWDRFLAPELKKIIAGNWVPDPKGTAVHGARWHRHYADSGRAYFCGEQAKIEAARDELMKGQKIIYSGPMSDRDGKERIAAGKSMPDADLWKMDWFVKGVASQQ